MGQTLAILRSEGKVPSISDLLTISLIGVQNRCEKSLRRLVGILLGPEDFPEPKSFMILAISVSLQGSKVRVFVMGFLRKSLKFRLDFGIFLSIEGPIFE